MFERRAVRMVGVVVACFSGAGLAVALGADVTTTMIGITVLGTVYLLYMVY